MIGKSGRESIIYSLRPDLIILGRMYAWQLKQINSLHKKLKIVQAVKLSIHLN